MFLSPSPLLAADKNKPESHTRTYTHTERKRDWSEARDWSKPANGRRLGTGRRGCSGGVGRRGWSEAERERESVCVREKGERQSEDENLRVRGRDYLAGERSRRRSSEWWRRRSSECGGGRRICRREIGEREREAK